MGHRGPPKKPSKLKVIQGTAPPSALDKIPQPDPGEPVACPRWVGKHGKELWARIFPQLHKLGLVTVLDQDALAIACQAYHDYRIAQEKFDPTEDTTAMRRIGQNVNEAYHRFERLMKQFGLTPSAREGLSIKSGSADPFEEFL